MFRSGVTCVCYNDFRSNVNRKGLSRILGGLTVYSKLVVSIQGGSNNGLAATRGLTTHFAGRGILMNCVSRGAKPKRGSFSAPGTI